MKKFFSKVKNWFIKHKPSKRKLIQLYSALLYNANIKGFVKGSIYKGGTKNLCVPGLNCYSCPGAVGACPLGALQNALGASARRAPFYVIGIIVLFGLLLGRTICGFLCPVGLIQELLYKIKTPKLKKGKVTRILSYFKYVLLVVLVIALPIMISSPTFCKLICPAGVIEGAVGLLANPSNTDMFASLGGLFSWKFCLMIAILVASVFIFRFFCRFFCPLGALYGLFNKISLIGVKFDKTKCTDCGLCVSHCKMDIRHVGDHECINCGECIAVCPTKAISWKGSKLFLHPNAVDGVQTAPSLNSVLEKGTTLDSGAAEAAATPAKSLAETQVSEAESEEVFAEVREEATAEIAPAPSAAAAKVKKRNKILQITAWAVALVVLVFAFVYYNFLAPYEEKHSVYTVGDVFPDFTIDVYNREESYTLSSSEGKVVVLNFWATWCTGCILELPDFERFQNDYEDKGVQIVAVDYTAAEDSKADVEYFLEQKGWMDYKILFGADDKVIDIEGGKTYLHLALGGTGALPVTVVIDKAGVIRYNGLGELSYEGLQKIIDPLLA